MPRQYLGNNGAATAQQSSSGWGMFGAGAATGVGAAETYEAFRKTQTAAKVGMWTALLLGGIQILGGQQAMTNSNAAMTYANSIAAGGTYTQADAVAQRNALQQLALACQNLSITGYTNLTSSVQPSASASVAPPAQSNNNGVLLVAVAVLGVVFLSK